jgi:hypothetical protein
MKRSSIVLVAGLLLITVLIVVIVLLTAAFTPENTNPAFAAAIYFVHAAGTGADDTALNFLNPALQTYVAENCPDGRVSACVQSYTPPEWGAFRGVVFRRAVPDGPAAWDIDLIATYEQDKGFSGVCIYTRMEQDSVGDWRVAAWAGFVHCGESAARNMVTNPDTPNRVP